MRPFRCNLRRVKTQTLLVLALFLVPACKDKSQGTGIVYDAGPTTTTSATPPTVDPASCCQLATEPAWTFEGIYRDNACTEPLAQAVVPACGNVPALGQVSLTYVDAVGLRKANESTNVTLAEQVAPEAQRFRKAGTTCVRANEGGVDLTPPGCAGQRVCRDANGTLVCAACRTFANGCGDFEQTRLYATITDPGLKSGGGGGGGGGNIARLAQCCNALKAEAARLGPSPEAGMINSAAAQCLALVQAAGPNGNAPELGAIRTMLAGRPVPAVCAGF